jgi:hypothetical protein
MRYASARPNLWSVPFSIWLKSSTDKSFGKTKSTALLYPYKHYEGMRHICIYYIYVHVLYTIYVYIFFHNTHTPPWTSEIDLYPFLKSVSEYIILRCESMPVAISIQLAMLITSNKWFKNNILFYKPKNQKKNLCFAQVSASELDTGKCGLEVLFTVVVTLFCADGCVSSHGNNVVASWTVPITDIVLAPPMASFLS